ncbi:VOC family protein [Paenibacillus daejeonensis]|uniref:VOC family protein n=1 Tax=Paenibacillus daejeonensis TaxID=135193 RepID=UPI00036691E0|nr:VOC family protein [Paenibacillus daejeonensis]
MLSASPFIIVDSVRDALDYYQPIFGGEIKILNENKGTIYHAELHLGSSLLHFAFSYNRIPKGENVRIIMQFDNEEEIKNVFELLAKEGSIVVPLEDTFFGALHGEVIDAKNGICWVLNHFRS